MKTIIKLNDQLSKSIDNNILKAKDVVKFILENVEGSSTIKKDINNTSIQNIMIDGKNIKNATLNRWEYQITLEY